MNARHLVSALIAGALVWPIGFACAQEETAVPGGSVVLASPAAPGLDPAVVKANLEKAQQQAVLANRLADKFQGDAAARFGASFNAIDWKRDFGSRLMYQPVESLSAALTAPSLSMVQDQLFNANKVVLKHASSNDWVLHVLTPCRIVDTRIGGGGMLAGWRTWSASNTAAVIAAQGGAGAGCGTFPNADGFLLYVTAVPPGLFGSGGANFLTVQHDPFPTPPTASNMNYYPGDNIANFAITECNGCSGGGVGNFSVYASGTTDVVIDLVGWAGRQGPTALDCLTTADTATAEGSGVSFSLNPVACPAGYTMVSVNCRTSNFNTVNYASMGVNDGGAACQGTTNSAITMHVSGQCCRVPILSDTPGG